MRPRPTKEDWFMRIALISNTLPPEGRGGAEAYVSYLAASLAREHDVVVLTGATSGAIEGASIGRLPALPRLAPDASLEHKLVWHSRDQWRPTVFRSATRLLRNFRPDVVHTHECQGLSAAVFSAIDHVGLPHVHTAHDLNLLCARVTMTRDGRFCGGRCRLCRIQRTVRGGLIRRRLAHLISVSDYIEGHHLAGGIAPRERASVVRLGAPVPEGPIRRQVRPGLHIGFIGTLAAYKGVATLLQAFARSDARDWRLTIAGSGPLEPEVAAAARGDSRITFLGQIDGDAKEAFFDSIDLLAVPSEWEEPAAYAATEAIARGLPTLVSDRGGLPEIAEAHIVRSRDPAALLEALRWLHEHPRDREATTERLARRRSEFSWPTHFAKVEKILAAAVAERVPDRG
jgi:glycosyltransferase involved in cell wall biosynthesis